MIIPAAQDITVVPGGDFYIGVTWLNNGTPFDISNKTLFGSVQLAGTVPSATPAAAFVFNIDNPTAGHYFVSIPRNVTKNLLMGKLYVYSWLALDTVSNVVDEIQCGNVILTLQPTLVTV